MLFYVDTGGFQSRPIVTQKCSSAITTKFTADAQRDIPACYGQSDMQATI